MAEEEQKYRGRLAAAVLAGSALTFSSFAIGMPAALADTTAEPNVQETGIPDPEEPDAPVEPTAVASATTEATQKITDEEGPEDGEEADDETASETDGSDEDAGDDADAPEEHDTPSPLADDGDESVAPGDQTLTADRTQINLDDFINDPDSDDNQGVNFTAEGFEPFSTITYEVVSPGNVEGLSQTAPADENGTVQFYIYGPGSASDPEVYLGEYTVTVTGENKDGEELKAEPVSFTVVDEGGDDPEDPNEAIEISLAANEGQAGDSVTVTGTNFQADGDVDLLLEDASEGANGVELTTTTADADGNIEEDVTIPEDTADGNYNIIAVDTNGSQTSAGFTVTSDDEDDAEDQELYFHHFPGSGSAGTTFEWGGSNFTEDGEVTLTMTSADGGDSLELASVIADENGLVSDAEATIPEDTANGVYTLTALDVETGSTVDSDFNVTDASLTITPEELDLTEFREGGSGVTHTVEGLEPGTEVEFRIGTVFSATDLGGTVVADEDGVAEYVVNTTADGTYVGNYYTNVLLTEGDVPIAEGSFEVTSELPQIWLAEDEVYQGESLDVYLSNLTPDGEITVEWNPTETLTAEGDGSLNTELAIAEDAATGVQEITVTDETTGQSNTTEYTVLEAGDQVTEPALNIDPEEIELADFVGEPEDGAGVAHTVEGIEAGAEISYVVSGPEGVNDYEQTANADDDGLVEFVIAGFDVSDPSVYLGDYTTVVTYEDENGDSEELSGNFSVVTEDGETPGDDNTPGDSDAPADLDDPVDMNGEDLATTGANTAQLGWLAGGLLALGVAFFAHANRARLFGRKH